MDNSIRKFTSSNRPPRDQASLNRPISLGETERRGSPIKKALESDGFTGDF